MASVYREHKNAKRWSARVRIQGRYLYKSGFKTKQAASNWANEQELNLKGEAQPFGLGPTQTTVAAALRDYAERFSVLNKGCPKEITRINAWLRPAGLAELRAKRVLPEAGEDAAQYGAAEPSQAAAKKLFQIEERASQERPLPKAFGEHREKRLAKRRRSLEIRARLAVLPVSRVAPYHVHELVVAMVQDGYAHASIVQEVALLKSFFNRARVVWKWQPLPNPVDALGWKPQLASRERVLSHEEEKRLARALAECANPLAGPFVWLAIETSMRRGEQLETARWSDIDWEARTLRLADAKGGARLVPLTQAAVAILRSLPQGAPHERVFPMSANALHLTWKRACERAGIQNLRIHDLRHTALTRHSKRLNGNVFLLQLVSGHRTLAMLRRYVNPGVQDVLAELDKTEAPPAAPNPGDKPADEAPSAEGAQDKHSDDAQAEPPSSDGGDTNVVPFPKPKRRAA